MFKIFIFTMAILAANVAVAEQPNPVPDPTAMEEREETYLYDSYTFHNSPSFPEGDCVVLTYVAPGKKIKELGAGAVVLEIYSEIKAMAAARDSVEPVVFMLTVIMYGFTDPVTGKEEFPPAMLSEEIAYIPAAERAPVTGGKSMGV